jgi:hypothetical protein
MPLRLNVCCKIELSGLIDNLRRRLPPKYRVKAGLGCISQKKYENDMSNMRLKALQSTNSKSHFAVVNSLKNMS